MFADEDLHRHAAENLDKADALLFGRVTYEMMKAAWRPPARTGAKPDQHMSAASGCLSRPDRSTKLWRQPRRVWAIIARLTVNGRSINVPNPFQPSKTPGARVAAAEPR